MRALLLLIVFAASTALAESGAYRVEVIVFRNLAVSAEATPVDELRSFSQYPDLLEPLSEALPEIELAAGVDELQATPAEPSAEPESQEPEPPLPEPIVLRPDLPEDLRVVQQKSPAMDDAWRRLRGSRDYRPLLYAGWEQNRVDYYPPVRVHDGERIDRQLRPPTDFLLADLTAADPLAPYRSDFFRLDGSLQLWRSRFLHVYLDIEYRESGPWLVSEPAAPGGTFDPQPGAASAPYTVFTLKQNRQVRTNRMQYFDTPQFGALVLVTAVTPEAPQG